MGTEYTKSDLMEAYKFALQEIFDLHKDKKSVTGDVCCCEYCSEYYELCLDDQADYLATSDPKKKPIMDTST